MARSDGNGNTPSPSMKLLKWILITVVVLGLLVVAYRILAPMIATATQQQLPTVLLLGITFAVGALLLLAALIAFALVGRKIDGAGPDVRGALSLPHGSISAILALLILVVFSLSSIHVYSEIRAGEDSGVQSRGVTQEALAALPDDRVLEIQPEPVAQGQPQTYIVKLANPHAGSTDFANELMTIFATLLIAIVGFYFGQGATAKGVREARLIGEGRGKGKGGD